MCIYVLEWCRGVVVYWGLVGFVVVVGGVGMCWVIWVGVVDDGMMGVGGWMVLWCVLL